MVYPGYYTPSSQNGVLFCDALIGLQFVRSVALVDCETSAAARPTNLMKEEGGAAGLTDLDQKSSERSAKEIHNSPQKGRLWNDTTSVISRLPDLQRKNKEFEVEQHHDTTVHGMMVGDGSDVGRIILLLFSNITFC